MRVLCDDDPVPLLVQPSPPRDLLTLCPRDGIIVHSEPDSN